MTTHKPTAKVTIINKNLIHYNGAVMANPFEATKAFLIAHAECKLGKFLPYSVGVTSLPDHDPEYCSEGWNLGRWYISLSSDNPPGPVQFTRDPALFRKLVEPLDLSKPVDDGVVEEIRAQFVGAAPAKAEVDAAEIEENCNAE